MGTSGVPSSHAHSRVSDHNMVQLTPLYKQKSKCSKPAIRSVKTWSHEAMETLNGCFECTDWSVFLEDGGTLDEAMDVIPSYIKFCTDVCLETKVKLFPNTKPWVTKELKLCYVTGIKHLKRITNRK